MLLQLALIAAGVALVGVIVVTTAASLYVVVTLGRRWLHKAAIKAAKDELDLSKLRVAAELEEQHARRLAEITNRLGDMGVECFLAELDAKYEAAAQVPQVTLPTVYATHRNGLANGVVDNAAKAVDTAQHMG